MLSPNSPGWGLREGGSGVRLTEAQLRRLMLIGARRLRQRELPRPVLLAKLA